MMNKNIEIPISKELLEMLMKENLQLKKDIAYLEDCASDAYSACKQPEILQMTSARPTITLPLSVSANLTSSNKSLKRCHHIIVEVIDNHTSKPIGYSYHLEYDDYLTKLQKAAIADSFVRKLSNEVFNKIMEEPGGKVQFC